MNVKAAIQALDLPSEYLVVGEHRHDPTRLLLLGIDGAYYEFRMPSGETLPVEPDRDWIVETTRYPGIVSRVA